jgi:hypothetical protein
MRITQTQFEKMSRSRQAEVYFNHDQNLTSGRNKSQGPTVAAQAAFWNNWLEALSDFQNRLPSR